MTGNAPAERPGPEQAPRPRGLRRIKLPEWILIGLVGGIACGLFLGEYAARLELLGDVYVGLLQMTVLPYIVVSLISGIGKLGKRQARLLLGGVVVVLLLLYLIGMVTVAAVSTAYPPEESASFFSSSLVEEPPEVDFLRLFIPKNVFRSLAEDQVPAIVLFCLLLGVALMGLKGKQKLLDIFDLVAAALSRVTGYTVLVSPLGVFFISAAAAGTLGVGDIGRLQGYLITSTIATLGLGLGLLPLLITSTTPFRFRDLAPILRSSLLLAFATGKTLVVLPMLIEGLKKMFEDNDLGGDDTTSTIEILVPLGSSFPTLGRILSSIYVPFAAWFIGSPLKPADYPPLLGLGFFSHFSGATVAIPFQLDLMQLPSDLFQLFLVTGVYVARLGDAIGAVHILTLTVIGACAVLGVLEIQWRKLAVVGALSVVVAFLSIGATRSYLAWVSSSEYTKDKVIAAMQLPEGAKPAVVVKSGPNPVALEQGTSRLQRMLETGILRVGYIEDNLPFSYFNSNGDLVGFDIEMMREFAADLEVDVEFVAIEPGVRLSEMFEADHFDVAAGGIAGTMLRSRELELSDPYLYVSLALVVPDHKDDDFASLETMRGLNSLRVGVLPGGWLISHLERWMPGAEIVELESPRDFFERSTNDGDVDAFLYSAEAGAAWTLIYPRFKVVTPFPRTIAMPLVYPYGGGDSQSLDEVLDHWVLLKATDGSIDELFDYWILGKGAEVEEPRWSIVRNVLHWVD